MTATRRLDGSGIGADSPSRVSAITRSNHDPQRFFLGVALQSAEPKKVELPVGAAAFPNDGKHMVKLPLAAELVGIETARKLWREYRRRKRPEE